MRAKPEEGARSKDSPPRSETFTGDLGTNSASHSYSQSGTFKIRAVARDGNDVTDHGGNYTLSPVRTITVVPALDAAAAGHTLPGTITVGEFVATSVSMTNTGSNTWSGTSYKLEQVGAEGWTPETVGLGSASVDLNETHTFNFNIRMFEPEQTGFQDNFWKMSQSGNVFGEQNGTVTFVKSNLSTGRFDWIRSLAGWLAPGRAWASWTGSWPGAQEEVVQRLRVEDFPLPVEVLERDGEFRLRYRASLAQPWAVDFRFHIVFDPEVLNLGRILQGARSAGYRVRVESLSRGEVVIEGTRDGAPGLDGEGTIIEIPLVLRPGAEAPATLPLVELVATR